MKGYLLTTGSIFGLLALAHVWRTVVEWPRLTSDPWVQPRRTRDRHPGCGAGHLGLAVVSSPCTFV